MLNRHIDFLPHFVLGDLLKRNVFHLIFWRQKSCFHLHAWVASHGLEMVQSWEPKWIVVWSKLLKDVQFCTNPYIIWFLEWWKRYFGWSKFNILFLFKGGWGRGVCFFSGTFLHAFFVYWGISLYWTYIPSRGEQKYFSSDSSMQQKAGWTHWPYSSLCQHRLDLKIHPLILGWEFLQRGTCITS